MKKVLLKAIFIVTSLLFFAAPPALAYDVFKEPCASGTDSSFCQNVQQQAGEDRIIGPNGIITTITRIFVFFTGAVSVIVIMIGGLKYVLANGDSNAVSSAKNTILYALVGLVVALFAQVLVSFVLSKL